MKPELIEIKGDKGEHLNWRLIDTETNEIIWEEYFDDAPYMKGVTFKEINPNLTQPFIIINSK